MAITPSHSTPHPIVAIVQARMGSSRLPGKVLADVAGRSMLARVCRRVARAATVDRLVVAASSAAADRAIVDECRALNVDVFRGSEDDVLARYAAAADWTNAAAVVRVTADCPLIDPAVIDLVVEGLIGSGADYASNTLRRSWPRGLDCEAVRRETLCQACDEATAPHQRAHVTPFIYENAGQFRLHSVEASADAAGDNMPVALAEMRWTVDYPEDLEMVREVYSHLGPDNPFGWISVLALLGRQPWIGELNRGRRQKPISEC